MIGQKLARAGMAAASLAATVGSVAGCGSDRISTSTAAAPSSVATASSTAVTPSVVTPSAAPSASADTLPAAKAESMERNVGNAYQVYELASFAHGPGADTASVEGVRRLFADDAAFHSAWLSGAATSSAPMVCGAPTVDLVAVAAPSLDAAATASLAVTLSVGGRVLSQQAVVTIDVTSGKIQSITCRPTVQPLDAGLTNVVAYWGDRTVNSSTGQKDDPSIFAPAVAARDLPMPTMDMNTRTCAQNGPFSYVVYPAKVTAVRTIWPVAMGGTQAEVHVDSATGKIEWSSCLLPPTVPPVSSSTSPAKRASDMIGPLYSSYALELSMASRGATPADDLKPYFTDDAYAKALTGTGAVPFTCNDTASALAEPGAATVVGSTATFPVTMTRGVFEGGGVLGHAKITIDLTTFKITALVCQY